MNVHTKDLEKSFADEVIHFKYYLCETKNPRETATPNKEINKDLNMFNILKRDYLFETFPNISICLRIYLSLMISNCTGKRSFSTLKGIKNNLRSTMSDVKLNEQPNIDEYRVGCP